MASGRLVREFGPCGGGARIAFNHTGDRLAEVDDWTGQARLWDVTCGRQLYVNPPVTLRATALRFSVDDRWLTGSIDGTQLVRWRVGDGREFRTLARQAMPPTEKYIADQKPASGKHQGTREE